ncbi:oxidoreductase [Aliikangiella sp. IMCC44653]
MSGDLFEELVALESCAFPKKCQTCGKVFNSVEEYTAETVEIRGTTGLKASEDDDGSTVLELYRNCPCGSTLLDFFADRRDVTEKGLKRRKAFDTVLEHLVELGIEREEGRSELKYYMRHKKSELFEKLGVFKAKGSKKI